MSELTQPVDWREHWDVALRFRQRGINELREGDELVGAELIWGAAARATKAAATQLGLSHRSHSELFWVAGRLSELTGIPRLRQLLGRASALHMHFYESQLPPHEIASSTASAHEYIEAVGLVLSNNAGHSGITQDSESD